MSECVRNDDTVVEADTFELLLTDIDPDIDGLRVTDNDTVDDLHDVMEGIPVIESIAVIVGFTDGVILTLYDCDVVSLYNDGVLVYDIHADGLEIIVGDTVGKDEDLDEKEILGVILLLCDTEDVLLTVCLTLDDVDALMVYVCRIEGVLVVASEELSEALPELLAELYADLLTDTVGDTCIVAELIAVLVNEGIERAVLVSIICVPVAHRVIVLELVEDIVGLTECVFEREPNGDTVFDAVPVEVLDTLILLDNDTDAVAVLDCDEERL